MSRNSATLALSICFPLMASLMAYVAALNAYCEREAQRLTQPFDPARDLWEVGGAIRYPTLALYPDSQDSSVPRSNMEDLRYEGAIDLVYLGGIDLPPPFSR